MPELRVVSTYNPDHWSEYVQRNIRSWLEHLDAEFVIYHETEQPPPLQRDRICWREWEQIPGAMEFMFECVQFPPAQGRFGSSYDYNYDALKFCRKVFAQIDAAEESGDLLLWLDADVEVTRSIPTELLVDLLAGMPMATYQRPGYHSETGVVLWDMRHERAQEFFRGYASIYRNRRIFCLPNGWHDCWALDYVVTQTGMPVSNLTRGGRDYGSAHNQQLHVVPDSELGAYLRHDKGMRKHAA